MKSRWIAISLLLMISCSEPDSDEPIVIQKGTGIYVLNEGLWGSNNSSITYINYNTGEITSDLSQSAWNHPLGDTGNSFFIGGDTVFVCVTSSNKIEYFRRSTGEWFGSYSFPQATEPRFGICASDGFIYISSFKLGSLIRFNRHSLKQDSLISVGAFPEYLVESNHQLFTGITNLGSGNTVSVYNLDTRNTSKNISVGINPAEIMSTGDFIYVHTTGNLLSAPKSTIYKISPVSLTVSDSVTMANPIMAIGKYSSNQFYFITDNGVFTADQNFLSQHLIISKAMIHSDIIYSCFYNSESNQLWIASSDSYTTRGFLEGFVNGVRFAGPFQTGINPGDIITN